jgi:branched-chain amino acid transport system permease protein
MGVGAYTVAYFSNFAGVPVGLSILLAVAAGTLAGIAVGALVIRVTGVFFIMITLAMSMMFHAWASKARRFGGDDGVVGLKRMDLSALGLNFNDDLTFCLIVIAFALLAYFFFEWLARSPFGQTLKAIRQNENRIRAQGCPVHLYKLASFAVCSAVAAFAGALQMQLVKGVNPEIAHWFRSGEGLIMVIVGGAGTLIGPVIGAVLFELFHKIVESYTQYWRWALGAAFIAIVLVAPDGIYGRLQRLFARKGRDA